MAATRVITMHRNKGKTVAQCISDRTDYAKNPEKTDHGQLVSTYECNTATVDSEFTLSKREYLQITGREYKGDILAYQVRQSFKPGEISSEEANAIGYEFAKRFTKGNHAFIVCTHIDRQHVHNHIIWNSTTLDCTRKFKDFWGMAAAVRILSDVICVKHGLSIIEKPQKHGKAYNSWQGEFERKSNRDFLAEAIDKALEQKPKSFEDFFLLLQQDGYSPVLGKHIAFSHPRQKKNIRLRSLGDKYSEENIRAAILGNKVHSSKPKRPEKTNLLSDIERMINSGKGTAYQNWAKKFGAKQIAKSIMFLQEHNYDSIEDFEKELKVKQDTNAKLSQIIKTTDKRLSEITELKKHIINYSKTKDIYVEYRKSGYSKKYLAEHEADIIIHKSAKKAFDELKIEKLPSIKKLNAEYAELLAKKKEAYAEYQITRKEVREMLLHKQNYEYILNVENERNGKTARSHDIEK